MLSMHTTVIDSVDTSNSIEDDEISTQNDIDGLPLLDLPQTLEDFDDEGNGVISMEDFHTILNHYGLKNELDSHKLGRLKSTIDDNRDGYISYQEFVNVMSEKRTLSFSIAVRDKDFEEHGQSRYDQLSVRQKVLKRVADEILTNSYDRKNYIDGYSCCPPPVFMILISIIEISIYIYYAKNTTVSFDYLTGPVPVDSPFLYKPSKRLELWRFFTYMLIHAGLEHLIINVTIQLILGVPLEMVHGAARVGSIYFVGVLAGSLGTSVFDMHIYLCGASGGMYALLAGHLANVVLNFSEMPFGILRVICLFIIASLDVGFAIWRRYTDRGIPTAYVPHFTGSITGATIGLLILRTLIRNFMNVL
ncbi:LOW QUALITY PROTEIN: rhomboid-related protein 3-like [Saccoglossus kowalevskii]